MNTFELLDLTEAKELIARHQGRQALPTLYRLAATYPEDGEVAGLIQTILAPPGLKINTLRASLLRRPGPSPALLAALGGALLGLIGLFLPWIVVAETDYTPTVFDRVNGLAGIDRSDGLLNLINSGFRRYMEDTLPGIWTLISLGLLIAVTGYTLARPADRRALRALPVLAIIVAASALWNFIAVRQIIDKFSLPQVYMGPGFFITEIGSGIILAGTLVLFFRARRRNRPRP